jgi:myo-inositol catabolism protein IolC
MGGRAGADGIAITEEMVDAGLRELAYYYPEDNEDQDAEDRRAVRAIFTAMMRSRK